MSLVNESVLLKTPINPSTGYGNDGISLADELFEINADIHVEPMHVGVPLPPTVAALFTKQRPKPGHKFDVVLNHTDPGQLEIPDRLFQMSRKAVAWTMWEFTSFGTEKFTADLRKRLDNYDLILAYDEVSQQALADYADEDRIRILQGGYDSAQWLPTSDEPERDWNGTFRFGMQGALGQRKNPFAAINAFNLLKERHGKNFDAELHLKTITPGLVPQMEQAYPGLKIYYENWPQPRVKNFYYELNCLLAPSWGEGKNLPALQAMTTGCPVIASNFGGHRQWLNPSYSYAVGGELAEHLPGQKSMRVDVEELAELMWHVYNNRAEAENKGDQASSIIPAMCDWSRVVERLRFILNDVSPKPRPVDV